MRFLLLALLIALLPLRGWAGAPVTTTLIAAQAQPAGSTGQFDINSATTHDGCHGHVPAKKQCGDCQMCHALAAVATPVLPTIVALPYLPPRAADTHFDSAFSPLSLKPPIA